MNERRKLHRGGHSRAATTQFAFCIAVAVEAADTSAAAASVEVSVAPATARDARELLAHALPPLLAQLGARPTAAAPPSPCVALDVTLADGWRALHLTPAAERYSISVSEAPSAAAAGPARVALAADGLLGLAYALHALREHLALLPGAGAAAECAAVIAFARRAPPTPNFELRAWSEEGQLLALPDRGYYTADGLEANASAIAAECAALEAEVVPAMLRLRMNALVVLHSDLEDYVTYDSLPAFLPGAPAVYPVSSAHRTRRAGVVGVMAPWLRHLADAFGIQFFFQVYELSSPPGVCAPEPGGANATPALLNCTLGSPDTRALLEAKYSEVAAALPALAGVFVTVEDSWSPRAGYEFSVLWSGEPQLPQVVTLFHDAIVRVAGLRMLFRLWLFGQPVDWPLLRDGSPPDAEFSVKQTQGDFLLDYPINTLLRCTNASGGGGGGGGGGSGSGGEDCPPRDRRMIVEVDAFRQYNGWTSGVCYMSSQWAPRLAQAAAAGAADVWGWGSWAPGCTWPDSGPSLVNATAGAFKSWRGWWGSYRAFAPTATNGGFALGAQANAYLLSRLSWDALPANETQIALDFGTLFFGAANARAVAALLDASLPAWLQTSAPASVGDFTLFWTMMQHDNGAFKKLVAKGNASALADEFQAAADASAAAVERMEAALAAVDPGSVPGSNPAGYAGAARAVALSKAYLAALFAWRSAGLAVAALAAQPPPAGAAACDAAGAAAAASGAAAAAFDAAFPIESAAWEVGSLDAALYSAPGFLTSTRERTMAAYGPAWAADIAAACAA
jgi:hypothetical protein